MCGTVDGWITVSLQNFSLKSRAVKKKHFANRTEKCKFFSNLMEKEVLNSEDQGSPKNQDLADTVEELWIWSSNLLRQKFTPNCAERKANLSGNWTFQHSKS